MKPIALETGGSKFRLHVSSTVVLSLLVMSLGFVSCKKDKPDPQPQPTYHLNVTPSTVLSPAAATATNVTIEANSAWTITIPAGIDWIELNKTSGTANEVIQVKTKENSTATVRTTVLTVSMVNGKVAAKSISVEQLAGAQTNFNLMWKKVIGGNGNDYGYSIIKANDGGYLLSGRTSSNNSGDVPATKGGIDMLAIKMDAAGNIAWQKTYGGNADEYSVAAAALADGGYILTGYTLSNANGDVGSNHGATDFWVVKINAAGTLQWQKTLGGTGDDRPNAITITTEGKIAVAGYTASNNTGDVGTNHGNEDMWVVLLDNINGNIIQKKLLGGNGSETAKAIAAAPDGGVYVGGNSTSNNNGDVGAGKGNTDFWVLQLDKNLSIQWKKNLGGTNNEDLQTIATGPNNSLLVAGSTKSNNSADVGPAKGGEDIWVVQLNAASGVLVWQKVIGGTGIDVAKGALVKTDGSILLAGYTYSHNTGDVGMNHGAGDFWVLKLSATGNILSKKLLGGDDEDLGFSIAEGSDNGFVVAGSTVTNNNGDIGANHGNSDAWVVKLREE
jgi:hypothetical protein